MSFIKKIKPEDVGNRRGRGRASIVVLGSRRSTLDQEEVFPLHMACDCGSIAPRSRLDRATIAEFFHASSEPSDFALSDGDPTHMNVPRGFNSGRRIAIVRSPFDEHPTLIASPRGVR